MYGNFGNDLKGFSNCDKIEIDPHGQFLGGVLVFHE